MMKKNIKKLISLIPIETTIGFIYWLKETNDFRKIKDCTIEELGIKLEELQKEYNKKYPNGLTGWN